MTSLTRNSNLFNDMRSMQSQMNRLFEPFLSRGSSQEDLVTGTWIPPVDVSEEGDRIVLRVELPGIKQENIDISFADGVLTIKGERQFEKKTDENNYHRIERAYGTFVRSFTLPRSADPNAISADYVDGVLEIRVPKREESKPSQIRIGASSDRPDNKKLEAV